MTIPPPPGAPPPRREFCQRDFGRFVGGSKKSSTKHRLGLVLKTVVNNGINYKPVTGKNEILTISTGFAGFQPLKVVDG